MDELELSFASVYTCPLLIIFSTAVLPTFIHFVPSGLWLQQVATHLHHPVTTGHPVTTVDGASERRRTWELRGGRYDSCTRWTTLDNRGSENV